MRALFPAERMPGVPAITRDWLAGRGEARRFLGEPRPKRATSSPSSRQKPWAPLLTELAKRNQELGNPAGARLAAKLAEGAVAVVAGQQVALFGGQLLVLIKALEAIRIARALEESGTPAVPVFWMATEDHDLVEVCDARVDAGERFAALETPAGAAANRLRVGGLPIGDAPRRFLEGAGVSVPPELEAALAPGRTYAESFAAFLMHQLGGREILLLDAALGSVKWGLSRLFETALCRHREIAAALAEREREINSAGYALQVVHRDEQCHVFHLDAGRRRSLDAFPDGRIGPRDGSEEDRKPVDFWASLAEEHPDQLSPAVLLRPAAAASLLPQAVVVLGPSEVAYWAQALALFPLFGVDPPEIAPRPHVFVLDAASRRLLERLSTGVEPVLGGTEAFLHALAGRDVGGPLSKFRTALVSVRHHLEELREPLVEIDPTLAGFTTNVGGKIDQQLNLMSRKAEEAWARRDETRTRQAERLARMLVPEGTPQERHDLTHVWASKVSGLAGVIADALSGAADGSVVAADAGASTSGSAEDPDTTEPRIDRTIALPDGSR